MGSTTTWAVLAACMLLGASNVSASGRALLQTPWENDPGSQIYDSVNQVQTVITNPCQDGQWQDSTGTCVGSIVGCGVGGYFGGEYGCLAGAGATVGAVNTCDDGQYLDNFGNCVSGTAQGAIDNLIPAPVTDYATSAADGSGLTDSVNSMSDSASSAAQNAADDFSDTATSTYDSASNAVSDLGSSVSDAFGF